MSLWRESSQTSSHDETALNPYAPPVDVSAGAASDRARPRGKVGPFRRLVSNGLLFVGSMVLVAHFTLAAWSDWLQVAPGLLAGGAALLLGLWLRR